MKRLRILLSVFSILAVAGVQAIENSVMIKCTRHVTEIEDGHEHDESNASLDVSIRSMGSDESVNLKADRHCTIPLGNIFFIEIDYKNLSDSEKTGITTLIQHTHRSKRFELNEYAKILHVLPVVKVLIKESEVVENGALVKKSGLCIELDATVRQEEESTCTIL